MYVYKKYKTWNENVKKLVERYFSNYVADEIE